MTEYIIQIPNWRPATDNQLLTAHHMAAWRMKKADKEMVSIYGRDIPKAKGKRRVSLQIFLKGRQKATDELAYWKSLSDALTYCGLLVDDNQKYCEHGNVTFHRIKSFAGTVITLQEL